MRREIVSLAKELAKHDERAAAFILDEKNKYCFRTYPDRPITVDSLLIWSETPQGSLYWSNLHSITKSAIKEHYKAVFIDLLWEVDREAAEIFSRFADTHKSFSVSNIIYKMLDRPTCGFSKPWEKIFDEVERRIQNK